MNRDERHKSIAAACAKYISRTEEKVLFRSMRLLQDTGEQTEQKGLNLAQFVVEELGLGRTSVVATILYEMLYEKKIAREQIAKEYPPSVFRLIEGMEKIEELYHVQNRANMDIFQKLLLSLAEDVRVILIILARRVYALKHIYGYEESEQKNLTDEITFVYLPFAHRLGLYNVKMDMEDRLLRYNEPKVYEQLVQELEESKAERLQFIESFISPIKKRLDKEELNYEIKYRTKSVASILGKIRKQKVTLREVYDIFAIRIIINTPADKEKMDCWRVYSVVSDIYRPNPKRLRDWISIPKSTGYESLHTTVMTPANRWVEVQIRTQRMDEIAEKGFAAHWRYKGGKDNTILDEWLLSIREILEQEGTEGSEEVMDDLLLELSDKEIYVFTPNGDLKQLPRGASILDFAYSIHGDLGNTCTGGIVNKRNVPIRHVLQSGDVVTINTVRNQKPSRDWLQFAITSKAKSHIRQALKKTEAQEAAVGKEMLMRRMKNWGFEYNDLVVRDLLSYFKTKQANDFYYAIATNKIEVNAVKDFLTKSEQAAETELDAPEVAKNKEAADNGAFSVNKDVLVIADKVSGVDFTLSSCCSPVFGDDIFGFVSVTKGIRIHRKSCPNADFMIEKYPYRVVPACWTNQGDSSFIVVLRIVADDVHGIVNKVTGIFSENQKVNMRGLTFTASGKGQINGRLTMEVPNKGFLDMIVAKLQNINGVHKVVRSEK